MPVTLADWLQYLEQLHPREIDLGLQRVYQVAQRLHLPLQPEARSAKVITLAGTNGKGSTLAMTQAMAAAAGYRVGSYTSPHFLRFNERIQLQGQPVADALIIAAFAKIEAARFTPGQAVVSLSYFEFATLAALLIFAQADLDLWLLEVGLGGRLDAVNILDADVGVVTTIALDHQEYLGNDLEVIGYEKAGIFRSGCPAVLGSHCLPARVRQQAEHLGCQLRQLGQEFSQQDQGDTWQWQGLDAQKQLQTFTALPWPALPRDNAATAVQALVMTGLTLPEKAVQQGLAQVEVTGRMQRLGAWLLDVAHNPQAADYLAKQLRQEAPCRRLAIVGMMQDKDQAATLRPLLGPITAWMVTALPTPRAATPGRLQQQIETLGGQVVAAFEDKEAGRVYQAAAAALDRGDYDQVVVMGSFFTVALVLQQLPASRRLPAVTRLPCATD